MARLWIALTVAVVLLPMATPTVAKEASRAKVTYRFAEGVAAEDVAAVREGIRLAQGAYPAIFGVGVQQTVSIDVRAPTSGSYPIAHTSGHQITINVTGSQWPQRSPAMHLKTELHEWFHVLQAELSVRGGIDPSLGPTWLIEGSAEWAAYQALIERGIIDAGDVAAYLNWSTTQSPNPIADLRTLESAQIFSSTRGPTYALSHLAIEQLIADRGPAALRSYFEGIAKGKTWRQAFKSAFRLTPDAFYQAFATYRLSLAPTGPYPAALSEAAAANGTPAAIAIASVTSPVGHGDQALLLAWTDPGVLCTLVVTAPDGKRVLVRPATADGLGKVFWLWTVTGRLAATTATATVDCGADPAAVTLDVL